MIHIEIHKIITTEIMQSLYGHEILVQRHPVADRPVILPAISNSHEKGADNEA